MKILLSILSIILFQQEKVTINGIVLDSLTGNAIESVHIEIYNLHLKTKTNFKGRFKFKSIPTGTYQVFFNHPDYLKITQTIFVKQSLPLINIRMIKKPSKNEKQPLISMEDLEQAEISDTHINQLKSAQLNSRLKHSLASGAYSKRGEHFIPRLPKHQQNTEEYAYHQENQFFSAIDRPLSTFSIDVDGASYSNMRRFLKNSKLPPKDAIRVEEFINYFQYDYQYPHNQAFSTSLEISNSPWNPENKLIQIGIQSQKPLRSNMPQSHLTFLIDVSGSMSRENKLPLLKKAFKLLINQLDENDKVSIVVYAGAAGQLIEAVSAYDKQKILSAINRLQAGGSTAGGQGIQLAYKLAQKHFIQDGNNRIILATDSDFNIGISNQNQLQRLIEEKRQTGVFLSVMGFGMGNYKDSKMELLANKGNGNYAYIDNLLEAKKVFVNEIGATLHTIAKDVKLQVEFNPNLVREYRLIGYENRLLKKEDFSDDTKDAGELGAGHSVTALYEIVPADGQFTAKIPLKYQQVNFKNQSNEWLTVKIRYKEPNQNISKLQTFTLDKDVIQLDHSSQNMQFSAAVAQFAMLLRDSKYKGNASFKSILKLARKSKGDDKYGYRAEFIQLVELAELLMTSES